MQAKCGGQRCSELCISIHRNTANAKWSLWTDDHWRFLWVCTANVQKQVIGVTSVKATPQVTFGINKCCLSSNNIYSFKIYIAPIIFYQELYFRSESLMFTRFMTTLIFPKNLFQQKLLMWRNWHYFSENDKIICSACEANSLPTFFIYLYAI